MVYFKKNVGILHCLANKVKLFFRWRNMMSENNSTKKQRNVFITANKYQQDMILLTFLPSALIFLGFVGIVFIGNPALTMAVFHTSFFNSPNSINQFSELIVILMCSFLLLSIYAAFIISHNMIGAFGRVIKELDAIIAGHSQRAISSRPNDTLTKDLLKRVNFLVEYYLQHEKRNF